MNMFARFDENPAMTLRVIKETKRYGRTDARTDNVKTVYPLQTKFVGGIKIKTFMTRYIGDIMTKFSYSTTPTYALFSGYSKRSVSDSEVGIFRTKK